MAQAYKLGRRWKFAGHLALTLTVALSAACSDSGDGPTGLDPDVYELSAVSGAAQTGLAGTLLADPLVVRVRRKDTGAAEQGVTVSWSVLSGSGSSTRRSVATDEAGEAATRVVLGGTAGTLSVRASVTGLPSVTFGNLTVLPAPVLESVTPASADPGDVVAVQVRDLPATLSVQVLFDGVEGEIVSRVDGATTTLNTTVPAPAGVCSATSSAVDVRVRAGGLTTAARQLSVSVPADPFQVGQVLVVEGTDDVSCALLPADGGNAKYLLVALSAQFELSGNFQVTLGGNSVAIGAADAHAPADAGSFHSRLRAIEQRLVQQGVPPARPPTGAQLFAAPDVGDTRQFWVLNDVEATDDLGEEDFDRITATLKFVGANTLLYVDNAAPASGLSQADLDFLGELYDRRLYDADVDFFGEPTDVDGNAKVIVLLTPTVNALTPRDATGVIIGFFFGLDLFSPSTPSCADCRFSNGGEVFYGFVPDPDGQFSDARTRQRVIELLPGVMVHETQHMISFRYKVFENNLPFLETLWLSEALAHAAEELGGDLVDAGGDPDLADDLYSANFGRAARYLVAPDSFSLTSTSGTGKLGERGAWWLFVRWVADQYGDLIFRNLTQAAENGFQNVETQTGESFFRLFADWAVAMWADDQSVTNLAARYQVPKWQLRSIIRIDDGGGPVYALQPRQETFQSFRSANITRFLAGSSPFYVELDAAGNNSDLQLELSASTDAGLAILRYE